MVPVPGGKIEILVTPDVSQFSGRLAAGLHGATGVASSAGRAIGLALVAGTVAAAAGFKQVIDLTIDFQNSLNTLQAVSGATGAQMQRVSQTALALGNDLSLPATSAVDAAQAMTELAKGGLSVDQAMTAAKGTLQLAAAAQISAAEAAKIQSAALNAFGLSAENAGRVADVLANSANAAAGEITDFAQAMQQVGTIANSMGISLEDTATALSLFANAGIKGCYDDQTDVLTRDGYKPWADVTLADELATLNPETGHIEYQLPERLIRYWHTGKMYAVRNRHIDLVVTPEHRMWVRPRGRDAFEVQSAEQVAGKTVEYALTGEWAGTDPGCVVLPGFDQNRGRWTKRVERVEIDADTWARFLGYYLSEGSCDHGRHGYRVSIAQKAGPQRDKMLADLQRLPFRVTAGKRALAISSEQLYRAVSDLGHAHEKHVPAEVKGWSRPLLRTFYEAFRLGDGDDQGNLYTCSTWLRDDLEEIVTKCGWGARHGLKTAKGRTSVMRDGRIVTAASRDNWIVWVNFTHLTPTFDQSSYHSPVHAARLTGVGTNIREGWIDYDGEVFCATVPNHLLFVRRGGKTVISGNSDAGTLLKTALIQLASPTKQGAAALKTLGVDAFDAQGKFVGLETIFGQLHSASQRLTPELYAQAAATAFGTDAARLAAVAAGVSAQEWDKMSAAIGKQGGAAEVAAAKMKGLGGALEGFKSQLETAAIGIGLALAPALESAVRAATSFLAVLSDLGGGVGEVSQRFPQLAGALQTAQGLWASFVAVLGNVKEAFTPVVDGIGKVVSALNQGGSGFSLLSTALNILGGAARVASVALIPIGHVVGGLLSAFAALPGPIQSVALALLALKVGPSILAGLSSALGRNRTEADGAARSYGLLGSAVSGVTAPVRALTSGVTGSVGALRQFGSEMSLQRSLAIGAGESITRLGAAQAAFETSTVRGVAAARSFRDEVRGVQSAAAGAGAPIGTMGAAITTLAGHVPVLTQMRAAFVTAADGATRFGTAAGLAAAAGAGIRGALSGLVGALGGPWGLAITAAVVGLGLLGQQQQQAEQAAAKHRAAVDTLKGSLDQLTGAVTGATTAQQANRLASEDLGNGYGTVLEAAKKAGISVADYTQASLGNEAALTRVNVVLRQQAENLLRTDGAYANNKTRIDALGLSFQDVTEFALGNSAAVAKVEQAISSVADLDQQAALRMLFDQFRDAVGPVGALAQKLGLANAETRQAQNELRLAAEAQATFATAITGAQSALSQFGKTAIDANGQIKAGVQGADQLRTSFDGVATTAAATAQAVGEVQAKLHGVDAGAAAAGKSMQESRDAFVAMATAAGLSKTQAEALATSIGLVPAAAETNFRTNAAEVSAEIAKVKAAFDAVPGSKTVTVQTLSDDAEAKLTALGFKVERLPNGQIVVTANTDAAIGSLNTTVTTMNAATGTATLDANPGAAIGRINETVTFANGQTGVVTIDGNPDPATGKVSGAVAFADGSRGTITVDGNPDPATGKVNATVTYANGSTGTITVNANTAAAQRALDALTIARTVIITAIVQAASAGGAIIPKGFAHGGVAGQRAGGMADAMLFDKGGAAPLRGASRFRAGRAQIFPPRMLRYTGDRIRDDEFYIPDNDDPRSLALFQELARRRGYTLIKMYHQGGIEFGDQFRQAVLSRINQRFPGLSSGQVDRAQISALADIRSLLARINEMLARRGVGASIVVEDRSGDPQETARNTKLALRMA